ncbi:MAG TPA: ParB N-terminal domain-containing protein [Thermoleophilaceae bacterium]|nr:ParB N-terminal domain-containing protein [Thermoleophilaceae bacterium]
MTTLTSITNDAQALRRAIGLVPIESLNGYEEVDERRVAQIESSLSSSQELVNPIVVDRERSLLIDGHHRVRAFKSLGLPYIAAYDVPYPDDRRVQVRSWRWTTTAPLSAVRGAFDSLAGSQPGPWKVTLFDGSSRSALAEQSFVTPLSAALFVNRLTLSLSAAGHVVETTASPGPPDGDDVTGRLSIEMTPTVGKREVVEAVRRSERFPHPINRHLAVARPLALNLPLDVQTDAERFERHVARLFEACRVQLNEPGIWHDGRLYEEPTTTFVKR